MSLITEYSTNVLPGHMLVEVYDADACLGDDEAFLRSRTQVVAGNGYRLYVQTGQRDIEVRVAIRIWDAPRKPPEDAEGVVPVSLESETGQLVVSEIAFGPSGVMDLPRPGVYGGHATWSGREATVAYYRRCHRLAAEERWEAGRLEAAWKQCPAVEQYTLDLWFVRESEPEDDWYE
ncbi:hypothetical protein [Streptomyces sp. NPDC001744]|uniref:hypothetical protein n=1 Tax=Streptomyces sp. NPDC001744 TaxID=3364606 RepID=UPI0036AF632B